MENPDQTVTGKAANNKTINEATRIILGKGWRLKTHM
jgi:hypothetical protein